MVSETENVAEQTAALLDDLANTATLAAMQRDTSIPEGTLLAEAELPGGIPVKMRKTSSMVNMSGQPLPERFRAYDRQNRERWLPTAQMVQQLSKRHTDGVQVFTRQKRVGVAEPVPIADKCHLHPHKKFYADYDLVAHYELVHPREWAMKQREEERAEREADRTAQRELAEAMLAVASGRPASRRPVETAMEASEAPAAVVTTPAAPSLPPTSCSRCNWVSKPGTSKPQFALQGHMRMRHKGA